MARDVPSDRRPALRPPMSMARAVAVAAVAACRWASSRAPIDVDGWHAHATRRAEAAAATASPRVARPRLGLAGTSRVSGALLDRGAGSTCPMQDRGRVSGRPGTRTVSACEQDVAGRADKRATAPAGRWNRASSSRLLLPRACGRVRLIPVASTHTHTQVPSARPPTAVLHLACHGRASRRCPCRVVGPMQGVFGHQRSRLGAAPPPRRPPDARPAQ